MPDRNAAASPLFYARLTGFLYLVLLVCGPFSMMYVPTALVVPGDAAATADRILASPVLFRLGMICDSVIFLTEIGVVVLLYVLLRPVSRPLALVAALARLAMATVQGVNLLGNATALLLLSGADYLAVFAPDQLHALALLFLDAHQQGVYIWEEFFGLHCLLLGYLLYASGYFPRVLGALMALAGLGYLLDGMGNLLLPGHQATFAVIVAVGAMVGELPFLGWLLVKGVDVPQWRRRAAAAV